MYSHLSASSAVALLLFSAMAQAQTKPAPPSAPPPSGPSLSQTTDFIIGQITAENPVKFILKIRPSEKFTKFVTVTANVKHSISMASECEMNYASHNLDDSGPDKTKNIQLQTIDRLNIKRADVFYLELVQKRNLEVYTIYSPLTPEYFVLEVSLGIAADGNRDSEIFFFQDKGIAGRVAKAFAHAAALCGGARSEPF